MTPNGTLRAAAPRLSCTVPPGAAAAASAAASSDPSAPPNSHDPELSWFIICLALACGPASGFTCCVAARRTVFPRFPRPDERRLGGWPRAGTTGLAAFGCSGGGGGGRVADFTRSPAGAWLTSAAAAATASGGRPLKGLFLRPLAVKEDLRARRIARCCSTLMAASSSGVRSRCSGTESPPAAAAAALRRARASVVAPAAEGSEAEAEARAWPGRRLRRPSRWPSCARCSARCCSILREMCSVRCRRIAAADVCAVFAARTSIATFAARAWRPTVEASIPVRAST